MEKKDEKNPGIVIPHGAHDGDRPKRMKLTRRTGCVRCGDCCAKSSPSLLKSDLQLFLSGILSYGDVYTIRDGERVRAGEDEVYESFMELIKIKTRPGTSECVFYRGAEGCALYDSRPAQCREYECWSSASGKSSPYDVFKGLENESLSRGELFNSVDVLLEIISKHEEKCAYRELADAVEKAGAGDESAVERIMDMLQYDTYARPFLKEKFAVPDGALDLMLGRPLMDTICEFGLEVVREGDEYILVPREVKKEQ